MFARSSLAVMLMGTLFVVGCSERSTPTSLSTPAFALQASNADAAHACQKGGYQTLFRTDGTGFKNAGECASYAAQGGKLAKRQTATLTDVVYGSCNSLSLGYQLNGTQHILESIQQSTCPGVVHGADQTIHYLSTQTLRLFLRDDSCFGWIFYEDGPHGTVVGTNPYKVAISDAGGFCESSPDDPRPGANLTLTKTITSG